MIVKTEITIKIHIVESLIACHRHMYCFGYVLLNPAHTSTSMCNALSIAANFCSSSDFFP